MRIFTLLLISLFTITSTQAQILDKIKKVKDKITENTVDKLSRDPITTSFKDVDKKLYIENDFGDDASYLSFFNQPFDPGQGFTLEPGFYEGTFQSFCIKAGTTVPIKGRGRFYAPIKGPKADIMEAIIKTYQENPEYTQREVQLLLWAIIAKTDFAKMKGPVKATALKILTPSQIARLSKGALDKLTRKELRNIANESPAVRAVLEAENNLRNKYYSGARTYQDYEDIAMRAGVEPIVPGFEAGRWTKHPDGFFIRYYPRGYSRTTTQVYVPETAGITRFNPTNDVAVPPNSGQRLLQTSLPSGKPSTNTGGYVGPNEEDISCSTVTNVAIDEAVKQQMIMQNLPGLAVGVFKNGKIIHLKSYGYTDVIEEDKITNQTVMHWASISKSVTAIAAVQLQQDPSIDYDISDLATKHCSYWPNELDYCDLYPALCDRNSTLIDRRSGRITIDHLLRNQSGIQHYGKGMDRDRDDNGDRITPYPRVNDSLPFLRTLNYLPEADQFNAPSAVGVFKNSVLDFEPGDDFLYSSYGFTLAGATVEEASPNGYVDWVKRNIADVADMDSFQVANKKDRNGDDVKREGHTMGSDGILKISSDGDKESVLPAGGWESDICDLAKYAIGLASNKYYDGSLGTVWSVGGITYKYGVNATGNGAQFRVWHGGKHKNLRTLMHFFPSDTTGVVLIAPAVYSELPYLTRRLYKAIGERNGLYGSVTHTPRDKCRTDMSSGNDLFNGLWRKTGNDVIIRTGRPNEEFYEEVKRLRASGYHCKDIEAFVHNGTLYWDGVFQKGISPTKMWRNANKQAFVAKCEEMRSNGYRLYDVETYLNEDGKRLWAGVFRRTDDGYSVRLDRSFSEFANIRDQENANGKKLIDIEVYRKNGNQLWSGVFTKGQPNKLNRNYSTDDFDALVQRRRAQGYKLIDVEYYDTDPGEDVEFKVSGIWEKSNDDEELTSLSEFCDLMDLHEQRSANDYELVDWNRMADKKQDDDDD